MAPFDAATAIEAGKWSPRHARVLDVQVDGNVAAALIDPNGDGADLNVSVCLYEDGHWIEVASGNGSIGIPGLADATWTDDNRLTLTRTKGNPD